MDYCDSHVRLSQDIAVIKNDLNYIKSQVCNHIREGEAKGGYRDRLIIAEQDISALKKAAWGRTILAGLIGGLVSQLTPEVFQWLISLLIPH